jgi:hypothetical protein
MDKQENGKGTMAAPYYHRADAIRSFLSPEFAVDFIIVDCHTIPFPSLRQDPDVCHYFKG